MKKQLIALLLTCFAYGAQPANQQAVAPTPFFQMVVQELTQIRDDVQTLKAQDADQKAQLVQKDEEIVGLNTQIAQLQAQVAQQAQEIAGLNNGTTRPYCVTYVACEFCGGKRFPQGCNITWRDAFQGPQKHDGVNWCYINYGYGGCRISRPF